MFYKLIEKKRNEWLSSPECRVKDLIHYIEQQGKMRDAQKTDLSNVVYKAKNRSFCEGRFVQMYGAKMYSNYAIDLGLLAKNDTSVYLTPEGFKFVIQMQLHKSLKLMNFLSIN